MMRPHSARTGGFDRVWSMQEATDWHRDLVQVRAGGGAAPVSSPTFLGPEAGGHSVEGRERQVLIDMDGWSGAPTARNRRLG